MPDDTKYYQISNVPKNRKGLSTRLNKFYRKRQLVMSVIGAYVLVGGLLGFMLFNSGTDKAKASETASVTASIRLVDDKEFAIGDKIDVAITLQNTSITESINNLNVDLFSTKDSVNWSEMTGGNQKDSTDKITGQNNSFKLPLLSSGERAEYVASGILQSNQVDYLTILSKVRFLNKQGQQEVNTNRVFTKLKAGQNLSSKTISLNLQKDKFNPGEEVFFDLNQPADSMGKLSGKLFVSLKDTGEVVSTQNCQFDETGKCQVSSKDLGAGEYSAMFMDESEDVFSDIATFQVTGNAGQFTPNSQATLSFPFGSTSINGLVPVTVKRVVSFNESVKPDSLCKFEIFAGDKVVSTVSAQVQSDRSCSTTINVAQIPQGDGLYNVKLANSNLSKEISMVKKAAQFINLSTGNLVLKSGSDVALQADSIVNTATQPLNNVKVTLGIWHHSSGEYKETSFINGQQLIVQNGTFQALVPYSLFSKGGFYSVFIKTEDGQVSDFLNLNFDDKQVGLVSSGVVIDNYDNLKVGQDMTFSLQNVLDRNNNTVTQGDCGASIYESGSAGIPFTVSGEIRDGNCKVVVGRNKIVRSGPMLVSFTGPDISNKINQSRQFYVSAGDANKYGGLNLEIEPARKGYANNLIVGPVTDQFGNLANGFNYKLQVLDKDQLVQEFSGIDIVDGFNKLVMPSSVFEKDGLTFKLIDSQGNEVLNRTVEVKQDDSKLLLPNFPASISGDSNIQVGISALEVKGLDNCKLDYIRSADEFAEESAKYVESAGACSFDWNLNKLRDNQKGLLKFVVGPYVFNSILNQTSGDAANLFAVAPEVNINAKDELEINLLTSGLVDKNGMIVDHGSVKFQYNGKVEEAQITRGSAKLNLPANKLDSKDIRTDVDQRILDISLQTRASVTSIGRTNDLSIYLGGKEVSNNPPKFVVQRASTQAKAGENHILKFSSESCNVVMLSDKANSKLLKSHEQGDSCYVEFNADAGDYTLLFGENGFTIGTFQIRLNSLDQDLVWCGSSPCIVQVLAGINSKVEAVVYDEDKQYKFAGDDLDNVVTIKQNGLNPLKKYPVEIKYTNNQNEPVSFYRDVIGQNLVG